jgi:drug/metabolite transporter (DMT)-like permease
MANKRVAFAELSLVVVTIIWGLGFPITKIAINSGFDANTIMFGRFFLATILLSIVYFRKLKLLNKTIIKYGVITGVFLFLGFYFQTLGNVYTTPSKNGFITQLNIVFVPYLYFVFFKKRVDVFNIIAVFVALIGMFMLSYNPEGFRGINIGDIFTFICAIMVAFHVVTASYFQKKYDFDPAVFVLVNIGTSMIFSAIAMILFETLPEVNSYLEYWPLVFLGILNTALGFLVQSYALKISVPTRISLIVTLESIFAVIGSVLILNDVIGVEVIIGGLLIISAVLINEVKPFKKKNKILEV